MMKKRTMLATALFSTFFLVSVLCAQEKAPQTKDATLSSSIGDNWFVSAGIGGNLLFGEQDHERKAIDRLRVGGEISVGKWFNPTFGMRLQYSGGQLRGFNYMAYSGGSYARPDRVWDTAPIGGYDQRYTEGPNGRGFWQDFVYESLTIDVMANLTTLLRGYYKEDAKVEVIPFAGAGWLHSIKSQTNPTMENLGVKVGARVNVALHRRWALYFEPQATIVHEDFDGYKGTRGFDFVSNLMAGVQFHINKGFASQVSLSQDEIDRLNDRVNEQYRIIEGQQNSLDRQRERLDRLEKKQPAPQQQPVVQGNNVTGATYLPDYVRFGLNSATIDPAEKSKLKEAAAYMKERPNSRLLLIGYADRQTGNSDYNYQLSCRRVEAVAALLQQYGVDKKRLSIHCLGDKEQPYQQNDWNRVVVIVEKN